MIMKNLVTTREHYTKFNENFDLVKISESEYKNMLKGVVEAHRAEAENDPNSSISWSDEELFVVEQYLTSPRMVADMAIELLDEYIKG